MPLTLPQRDSDGFALPHDHSEIMNEDLLIRRISKTAAKESVVPAKSGGKRLSSAILTASSKEQDPYEGLSVDIEAVALELGLNPKKFMITDEFLGAVGLSAKCFRNETLLVGYDPQPDNECHGQVWGKLRPKRLMNPLIFAGTHIGQTSWTNDVDREFHPSEA